MHPFETVKFAQIEDRLPDDCWAKVRNRRNGGEFADETVLLFRGDTAFPALDLDDPSAALSLPSATDAPVFLILVEGDLTVASWIGNENTDGATGLVVKGDLRARNAVLGGQQLYVAGNLAIEELLWGDYNHGDLVVRGDTSAALFIATDQYRFDLRGERRFGRQLVEEGPGAGDWQLMDVETLSTLIEPACLRDDPDSGHVELLRGEVLDRLKSGAPVLRRQGLAQGVAQGGPAQGGPAQGAAHMPAAVPALFEDDRITIDNVLKVAAPRRMTPVAEEADVPQLEFLAGDILCRVTAFGREDEIGAKRWVYLQDDAHALAVTVALEEVPRPLWHRLWRKPRTGAWRMSFEGLRLTDRDDENWHAIEPQPRPDGSLAFPEAYRPLLTKGWKALLDGISTYEYAGTLIDPDEVRRLLALPVVEPYDDFYDEDACGFWAGQVFCAFRQQGALYDGEPQPALLRVSREHTPPGGRELMETYYFTVQRRFDGSDSVFIGYQEDQDSDEEQTPLSFIGGPLLQQALRIFALARRNLDAANRKLVQNGIPPEWDDGFAIRHWREKGLIARSRRTKPGKG